MDQGRRLSCKRSSKMVFVVRAIIMLFVVIVSTEGVGSAPIVKKTKLKPCTGNTCGYYCRIIFGIRLISYGCTKGDATGDICTCKANPPPSPPQAPRPKDIIT
ncbi:hypothetical protein L484_017469 [Morus notabilis]|uniref:Uncharacterized protein n=1 Tax=Morus notabilis TaxID=981085 RepID=W9QTT8_9ROSA|nr:hypothetical protein L484_017469 [Morus notabilis]